MIRAWLERHGWTHLRADGDDDLYTKGSPVCMSTAAALFLEMMDRDALLSMPFDEWWGSVGRFYDPDTADVDWYDKRKELADLAFSAGRGR